jgi:hypothetical protein
MGAQTAPIQAHSTSAAATMLATIQNPHESAMNALMAVQNFGAASRWRSRLPLISKTVPGQYITK